MFVIHVSVNCVKAQRLYDSIDRRAAQEYNSAVYKVDIIQFEWCQAINQLISSPPSSCIVCHFLYMTVQSYNTGDTLFGTLNTVNIVLSTDFYKIKSVVNLYISDEAIVIAITNRYTDICNICSLVIFFQPI